MLLLLLSLDLFIIDINPHNRNHRHHHANNNSLPPCFRSGYCLASNIPPPHVKFVDLCSVAHATVVSSQFEQVFRAREFGWSSGTCVRQRLTDPVVVLPSSFFVCCFFVAFVVVCCFGWLAGWLRATNLQKTAHRISQHFVVFVVVSGGCLLVDQQDEPRWLLHTKEAEEVEEERRAYVHLPVKVACES